MWAPFSGQNAETCANHSALSQIPYVFGDWRPVSWPKNEGRGTPCGCPPPPCGRPSSAIMASELRCVCPAPPRPSASSADKKVLRCSPCPFVAGQLHLIGQTHVRLPESGRGTPCGCPSQDITPGTVQIVVRYRKFSTSLATGGRFLGRKMKVGAPLVGALPPLWAPFVGYFGVRI